MIGTWQLNLYGLFYLLAVVALLLLGIHMMIWPHRYVGRGPVPAQTSGNVRAMGAVFAFFGGVITATFTAPIFLLPYFWSE